MILIKIVSGLFFRVKKQEITLDENLKDSDLLRILFERGFMVLRGILRGWNSIFGARGIVFFGKNVSLKHKQYIKIGSGSTLGRGVSIDGLSKYGVSLGKNVNLGDFSILKCTGTFAEIGGGIVIGSNVGIGAFSYIGAAAGVEIGHDCIMGTSVGFYAENHNYGDVSVLIRQQGTSRKGIKIGADCWVGSNAVFLDGCDVGRGCVVGAGSVVTKSFPEFSIIAGVPARVIGRRNSDGDKAINV